MVNISDLSNDEIKYICELMYLPSVRRYLQKNIKEFNRIRPGFTVKKMSDEDILSFLIKYSHKSLVQDLIRVVVQEWLVQIQDNISELVNQGFSSGEALIKTIPDCVFAERIELYFKLSDQPYDDKYLELLSDALSLVKRTSTTALQEHNSEIVSEEIQAANNEIEKLNNQLADREQCEKTMQQALEFSKIGTFGVPMKDLTSWLGMKMEKRDDFLKNEGGIPIAISVKDGPRNEFQTWLNAVKVVMQRHDLGKDLVGGRGVAIKAGQDSPYSLVQVVMDNLQTEKLNKFTLMTSLKSEEE